VDQHSFQHLGILEGLVERQEAGSHVLILANPLPPEVSQDGPAVQLIYQSADEPDPEIAVRCISIHEQTESQRIRENGHGIDVLDELSSRGAGNRSDRYRGADSA